MKVKIKNKLELFVLVCIGNLRRKKVLINMIDYKYYQETIFGKYEEFKIIMTLGDYCSLAEFKFKNHNILIILMLDKLQLLIGINIDKYVSAGISIPLNNKL